jgi:hypothetical protein
MTHWEYWPFQVGLYSYLFSFGLLFYESKIHFFFNASNPTIKNGGFIDSKKSNL